MLTEYELARLTEAVVVATGRAQSPWCDRVAAGHYCHCSASEIDKQANAGEFRRYYRGGTPMFKKSELDAWIERGQRRAAA